MRTFAIGDVHGCFDQLIDALAYAGVRDSDRIVMLGDYVDRGPDSARVIQFLIEQSQKREIHCLKGNHELMMLDCEVNLILRQRWEFCGGNATLDSYQREYEGDRVKAVPDGHWEFIKSCLPYFETETHVFVHAAVHGDTPMPEQPDYMLYWESFNSITPLDSGKIVVCGHSCQKSGIPKVVPHAVCIDTGACKQGWLTCLNVDSNEYFQVNELGDRRSDWLDFD